MDLSLFFAGTGGSVPSPRRGLPAILVRRGGDRMLFDCGEGTQRQLVRSVGLTDVDSIFITHFHADHWLGLPGMLKSFALRERDEPLTVYGPRGLKELMGAMRIVYGRLPYELSFVELAPAQTVDRDGYVIAAIPVRHRGEACFGYALVEEPRPGHLDARLAEELGVQRRAPTSAACSAGRPWTVWRPRRCMGPTAGGSQDRALRRHGAVRGARDRRSSGRPARARGDLRRGGGRAGAPDRPQHRAPGGASWRATRRCGCLR